MIFPIPLSILTTIFFTILPFPCISFSRILYNFFAYTSDGVALSSKINTSLERTIPSFASPSHTKKLRQTLLFLIKLCTSWSD